MKHLGDISKINGAEIEPVDIISFGSPCQDLSVAGKRAGLEGKRSGLFMEAVRIIKEMREATDGKYPRFALWENVPGAFSSNKGEDFRVVLEELIKIVEPKAVMPAVPKNGWAYADSHVGDGWSIAYRVLDTQYWPRTPQRRRRIYLVADFRGQCAREILFKSEGLRGNFAKSGAPWEGAAAYAEVGVGAANRERNCVIAVATQQGGAEVSENSICPTITAAAGMSGNNQPWVCFEAAGFKAGQGINARGLGWEVGKSPTLASQAGGNSVPSVCTGEAVVYNGENITHPLNKMNPHPGDPCHTLGTDNRNYLVYCLQGNAVDRETKQNGSGISEGVSPTLNSVDRHGIVYCMAHGQANAEVCKEISPCLNCNHEQPIVFDKEVFQSGENSSGGHYISEGGPAPSLRTTGHPPGVCVAGVDCRNMNEYPNLYPTLQAKPNGGQSLNFSGAVRDRYIVRRLTPTECARLQGFPDRWGHPDKKESLSDEEYGFWLEVRNTHAAINGKAVKDYTKAQMEKWYGKLHSDSAEYKMWGNGIALPTALYVMQGIAATR